MTKRKRVVRDCYETRVGLEKLSPNDKMGYLRAGWMPLNPEEFKPGDRVRVTVELLECIPKRGGNRG